MKKSNAAVIEWLTKYGKTHKCFTLVQYHPKDEVNLYYGGYPVDQEMFESLVRQGYLVLSKTLNEYSFTPAAYRLMTPEVIEQQISKLRRELEDLEAERDGMLDERERLQKEFHRLLRDVDGERHTYPLDGTQEPHRKVSEAEQRLVHFMLSHQFKFAVRPTIADDDISVMDF